MNKIETYNRELLVFSTGVFLLNPFAGVILLFNLLFSNLRVPKKRLTNLFIVFLSLFLSFINITKIPENDLVHYRLHYLMAGDYKLADYLSEFGKEPLYFVFNYTVFHISNGSVKFWLIVITFLSYFLFLTAIKRFFYKVEASVNQLIFGLMLAAFFPQLFSLTAHLIRQCIAASIFVYFAVDKVFYKNNKWWLPIIGILFHASSLLLFPLIYLKFLGNFKKYRIINILLIIVLMSYQSITKFLINIIGGMNETIDYILLRASEDTFFDLGEFPMINFVMMIFMIVIVLTMKKFAAEQLQKEQSGSSIDKDLKFFFSTMIILSLFIVANLHQSELSNRLFFYLFFYFPFVFPLFTKRFKQRTQLNYFFAVIFVLFFIYRLEFGVWTYAPLQELFTTSSFSFLFSVEPGMLPTK